MKEILKGFVRECMLFKTPDVLPKILGVICWAANVIEIWVGYKIYMQW